MDWFYQDDSPAGAPPLPMSVSEVSAIIAGLLDNPGLQDIRVKGELTNYSRHSRGHRYFSLSEKGGGNTVAVIRCVMWRADTQRLRFEPEEGMEVVVTGSVRHYAPHGAYQIQVDEMTRVGIGEKYLLVEKWKSELAAEGIFAATKKRPLPQFPKKIGVVTSETGSVIHDIRTVITRRFPVQMVLSPTAVQGEDAHREIAAAIWRLSGLVDVVIVARGGGSFEDLFPLNHPDVVRAIAACPVPVVSAVGHEVDVTLSDLAADVRAPTPSAAAEMVVPNRRLLLESLREQRVRLTTALTTRLSRDTYELEDLRDRFRPRRFLRVLDEQKQHVADLADRILRVSGLQIGRERLQVETLKTALDIQNPRAVLERGYCVARKDGHVVRSVTGISVGDKVMIRFFDGNSTMTVERVNHDGNV